MKRVIAAVIFYDKDLNILLQDRSNHTKVGEKFGFWGGGIEGRETPNQAIDRELKEELNFTPKELAYWGHYSFEYLPTGEIYHGELFLSPITQELLEAKEEEGAGKVCIPIDQLIENKNNELGPVTTDFLIPIKRDLQQIIKSA